MTIERKVGMGIAGQPSGGATDVADVFSTYLYNGTGSTGHDIVNGIDLDGEGGLVWIKSRTNGFAHYLLDTERGVTKYLDSTNTNGQGVDVTTLTHFNSTGFSLADSNGVNSGSNGFTSWTFRKKKKFFDIVTYSGNSTSGRTVSHSLGSAPAMMIIKQTNGTNAWFVYHKNFIKGGAAAPNSTLFLNLNDTGDTNSNYFNNTAPTDSVFTLGSSSGDWGINGSGENYVAYLFADNSAEDAEEQMIKCGTCVGTASVNLGWEPQFLLIKNISTGGNYKGDWNIIDSVRGMPNSTDSTPMLVANTADAETGWQANAAFLPNAQGFNLYGASGAFTAADTYVYMAIRAPIMVEPSAATDVFAVESYTGDGTTRTLDAAFGPVDMAIAKRLTDSSAAINLTTRATSKEFSTNVTDSEGSFNFVNFESNSLVVPGSYFSNASGEPYGLWAWKRAKGFFDVVAYAGTDTYRWQSHSLGAVPEMIWVKGRTADVSWAVYHKDVGSSKYLMLNDDAGQTSSSSRWGGSDPTDSLFRLGSSSMVNAASDTYVAYLFTTLDGISKCGSYVGNGTNQTIDCGFSAGARLILIKPSSTSGAWYLWDSARGIVAGGDPHLMLHSTAGQITGDDSVDPHNSGFKVNQIANTGINASSTTYIFYAIA